MKLRKLLILASGGVMLFGAACGGDKDNSDVAANDSDTATTLAASAGGDNANGGGGELGGDGCNTVLKSDIEGMVGAGFSDVQDSSQAGTVICGFQRGEPLTSVQYTIKPSGGGEFEPTVDYSVESGATKEDVDGIGEKAVRLTTTRMGVTVVQVIGVKGSALFYSTVTAQDGAISRSVAEDVARLLAERL